MDGTEMLMRSLITGLTFVAVAAVVWFVWHIFKATKDPDIREASDLRMDIRHFKRYRFLYDELQKVMEEHGANSIKAHQFFKEFVWPEVKNNPNEWRRYQDYRATKRQLEFGDYVNRTLYRRNK